MLGFRTSLCALAGALSIAACSSSVGTVPPGGQVPPAPAARGSILSLRRVGTITPAQMEAGLAGATIAGLGGAPRCAVALYAIRYQTIGTHDDPANASAAFFVPLRGCSGPFPLVAYAQGTNVVKAQKITDPTKANIEPVVIAAIYAAHGYAVAATDYLGLGYSTYPFQPYLVTSAEASAVIDSMRAARSAAARLHVQLSSRVLLTGHSQGGQSAMATQRAIEAQDPGEFHLVADAPSSGPYALTQTNLDGVRHPGQGAPVFAAYALTAYQKTYGNVYTRTSEVFSQPYARWVENLLPVRTYAQAAQLEGKTLPLALSALLAPSFVRSFLNDPHIGARVDMAKNDLLHGWKPVAPLALCGGSRDPEVEFKNSRLAYRYFKGEGANVSLTDVNSYIPASLPMTEYHDAVLVFCLTLNRIALLDGKRIPTPAAWARRAPNEPGATWPAFEPAAS